MPNWCYTTITITGEKADIRRFLDKHTPDGNFDFRTVIPEPETEEECPEIYNLNIRDRPIERRKGKEWFNWYDWNQTEWGCKWNSSCTYVEWESDDTCLMEYQTPWGSAEGIEDEIEEMYPELTFEFEHEYE